MDSGTLENQQAPAPSDIRVTAERPKRGLLNAMSLNIAITLLAFTTSARLCIHALTAQQPLFNFFISGLLEGFAIRYHATLTQPTPSLVPYISYAFRGFLDLAVFKDPARFFTVSLIAFTTALLAELPAVPSTPPHKHAPRSSAKRRRSSLHQKQSERRTLSPTNANVPPKHGTRHTRAISAPSAVDSTPIASTSTAQDQPYDNQQASGYVNTVQDVLIVLGTSSSPRDTTQTLEENTPQTITLLSPITEEGTLLPTDSERTPTQPYLPLLAEEPEVMRNFDSVDDFENPHHEPHHVPDAVVEVAEPDVENLVVEVDGATKPHYEGSECTASTPTATLHRALEEDDIELLEPPPEVEAIPEDDDVVVVDIHLPPVDTETPSQPPADADSTTASAMVAVQALIELAASEPAVSRAESIIDVSTTPTDAESVISDVGEAALKARAETMRRAALDEIGRKLDLERARRRALSKGHVREAFLLSMEARRAEESAERLHRGAARRFFAAHNAAKARATVDLHGLRVAEAVGRTEYAIRDALLRGDREVRVIVGRGNHSLGGKPVLRPAVLQALAG